jgi:hypothetical protein
MANDNAAALATVSDQMERLKRMMNKAHSVSSRKGDEMAARWVRNICFYLYKRCAQFSPKAEAFGIGQNSIAVKHGWKIANLGKNHVKLPSKWSKFRVAEIMRQRGKHRMFIASGWLTVKAIATASGGERLQTMAVRNGAVIIKTTGLNTTTVSIINTSEYARSFHEKHGIVPLAIMDETEDLAQYVSRKTHQDIQQLLKTT